MLSFELLDLSMGIDNIAICAGEAPKKILWDDERIERVSDSTEWVKACKNTENGDNGFVSCSAGEDKANTLMKVETI